MKLHLLLLAVVALSRLPRAKSGLVGYDCAQAEVVNIITPNEIVKTCTALSAEEVVRAEIHEVKGPKSVVGYRCQVRYKQSLVNWRGVKRPLPPVTSIIGREACLDAHNLGHLDLEDRIPHLDRHGTTEHSIRSAYPEVKFNQVPFDSSHHDHYYERDYVITLSQHSGWVDFQENIVRFDNGISCDFSNFSCVDDHIGELAWTSNLQQNLSTSIFGGNITFVAVKASPVTPEKTYAVMQVMNDLVSFRVLADTVKIDGNTLLRTNHPDMYIRKVIWKSKVNWSHFSASKIYEYVNLTRGYSEKYDLRFQIILHDPISHLEIASRLCQKEAVDMIYHCDNTSNTNTSTVGCVIPLSEPGMIGTMRYTSTEIIAKKCQRHIVQIRESNDCFNFIPVRYKRYQFLNPVSRILVDQAESAVCTDKTTEKFGMVEPSHKHSGKTKQKSGVLPDWALLMLIVFACLWGVIGIIKVAQLIIRKRHNSVLRNDAPTVGRFTIKSSWLHLTEKFPEWAQRYGVQEETGLNVKFSSC